MNSIYRYFKTVAAESGITFNPGKSALWRPSGSHIPDSVLPEVTNRNLDGILVLGTPVGSDEFVRDEMMEIVTERYDAMHSRLQAMGNAHAQYLLTRYCCCNNLNHWLRTVRPDLVIDAAEHFDAQVDETIKAMLSQSLDNQTAVNDIQLAQARQIIKRGGLGLLSARRTANPAWLASWSLTKTLLGKVFADHHTLSDVLDHVSTNPQELTLITSISDTWDEIRSLSTPNNHYMPDKDRLEDAPNKSQKHYTAPLHKQLDKHIMELNCGG